MRDDRHAERLGQHRGVHRQIGGGVQIGQIFAHAENPYTSLESGGGDVLRKKLEGVPVLAAGALSALVVDHELKTPPRRASYVQMSIRSVATKKIFNLRLTSNDSLEGVVLERTPHEYSYKDSSGYHFLDPNTYEDALVYEDLIENVKNYLIEGQTYTLLIADGIVVSVELPLTMTMTVAESSEGVKGDSANNVYKPAVMETGLVVQVPLFINVGERINVKTEDNSYLGRA